MLYLFPLTSKSSIVNAIKEEVNGVVRNVEILQTAQTINTAANNLRSKYIQFIAELPGQIRHRDKNLKDFFAIDNYATLWWFSLISEKNIYKSDTFNRFAQLDSIIGFIRNKKIEKIIFWGGSQKLGEALLRYASENQIGFEVLPKKKLCSFKTRILRSQKIFYLRHLFSLLDFAIHFSWRLWRIKRKMHTLNRTVSLCDNALLLVTPYPSIDTSLVKKGIFKNKFYPSLQEALEAKGEDIIWAAMYVENNSISFRESLRHAQAFVKNGYSIFFIEEFSSILMQMKAFLRMFKNGLKFLGIERSISKAHTFGSYNFYPLFRDDWYSSFVGHIGYTGILYYGMFRSLLSKVKAKKCLYLCEMQSWEKALITARQAIGSIMPLYAYQSTTVSKMFLSYFNDPNEISDNSPYAIPRPEKILCNGGITYGYMKHSGWPEGGLSIVEAIRYNYLKGCMKSKFSKKKNIVLVICSINPKESSSILNIASDSLKDLENVEIWIKPHPFLQIKKVFELTGLSEEGTSFKIKNGPIGDLLSEARMVIVGESGVSLEALAYGCKVLIVNTPEWINMSPLKDAKSEILRSINSPEELKQTVIDIFKEDYNPDIHMLEGRRIIDEYFCLNQDTDIPCKLLKLLTVN